MTLYQRPPRAIPGQIVTPRLTLRPLLASDEKALCLCASDPAVGRMLTNVPYPFTPSDFAALLSLDHEGGHGVLWVIDLEGDAVGVVSIGDELGYWLARHVWGLGLMSEAVSATVDAVFLTVDLPALRAAHFDDNRASRRVLQKVGFRDVGPFAQYSVARGAEVPGRLMLLTRETWQARRG